MDMFDSLIGQPHNLLPSDGEVLYYGPVVSVEEANQFRDALLADIAWQHDQSSMYGRTIITKRKVAWYGDRPYSYTYSKTTKIAKPWIPLLLKLKALAEEKSGERYNACLLNLYHNGDEGMAWHSDAEKDLKANGAIGSLSFGAARKFSFKHKKTGIRVSQTLEHGSLLVMKGSTQAHWLHRLPPCKNLQHPRVNLTFRCIDKG